MLEPLPREKFQRQVRYQRRHKKMPTTNRHHMTNRVRGGKSVQSNLLTLKRERHDALHQVFKNMSWAEIGDALYSIFHTCDPERCFKIVERVSRIKGYVP